MRGILGHPCLCDPVPPHLLPCLRWCRHTSPRSLWVSCSSDFYGSRDELGQFHLPREIKLQLHSRRSFPKLLVVGSAPRVEDEDQTLLGPQLPCQTCKYGTYSYDKGPASVKDTPRQKHRLKPPNHSQLHRFQAFGEISGRICWHTTAICRDEEVFEKTLREPLRTYQASQASWNIAQPLERASSELPVSSFDFRHFNMWQHVATISE